MCVCVCVDEVSVCLSRYATSAYVSIRQHTSAYVSIRQHTSAYVSIRCASLDMPLPECVRSGVDVCVCVCVCVRARLFDRHPLYGR